MEYYKRVRRVIWVVVILIVLFLGLKSPYTSYGEQYGKNYQGLYLYGISIGGWLASDTIKTLGEYKFALIGATLLIGLAAIATMNKNKANKKSDRLKKIWRILTTDFTKKD
jgi:hypothetical protein